MDLMSSNFVNQMQKIKEEKGSMKDKKRRKEQKKLLSCTRIAHFVADSQTAQHHGRIEGDGIVKHEGNMLRLLLWMDQRSRGLLLFPACLISPFFSGFLVFLSFGIFKLILKITPDIFAS